MRVKFTKYPLILAAILLLILPSFAALAQVELSETYTSMDGSLSFKHPAGWVVQGEFGMTFGANSQTALETEPPNMTADQLQFIVIPVPPEQLEGVLVDGPDHVLSVMIEDIMGSEENVRIGEPKVQPIEGRPVASVTVSDEEVEGLFIAIQSGEHFISLVAITAPGGIAAYEATLLAMAVTIEYDAAAAESGSTEGFANQADPGQVPAPVAGTGEVIWHQQAATDYSPDAFGVFGAIAVGANDMIYVADSINGVIAFNPDGTVAKVINNTNIITVRDIAVGADGTLWIADSYSVQIFNIDTDGNILSQFGQEGADLGQFGDISPEQIEIGTDGNLYVLDINEDANGETFSRVEVFAPDGSYLREFMITQDGDFGFTYGVKMSFAPDGRLFVGDFLGAVRIFDMEGNLLQDGFASDTLDYLGIGGVAVDAAGSVLVATNEGVYKFDANGTQLAHYGVNQPTPEGDNPVPPFAPGQFYDPVGVVVLSNGDVVVVDTNYSHSQLIRLRLG